MAVESDPRLDTLGIVILTFVFFPYATWYHPLALGETAPIGTMPPSCKHEKPWCGIPWYWREPKLGDHAWAKIILQDKAIHIQVPREDDLPAGQISQIGKIFRRRDQALQENDIATLKACQNELEVLICEASCELFPRVAPMLHGGISLPSDLYSRLHTECLYFKAVLTGEGKVFFEAREHRPQDADAQFDLARRSGRRGCDQKPCNSPDLPDSHVILDLATAPDLFICFDKEISVLERFLYDEITRVIIPSRRGSQEMLCKVAVSEPLFDAVLRELQCLLTIAALDPAANTPLARAPKLLALVRSSDHGGVIGLVETYVPHAHTLFKMDLAKVDVTLREKWICQINETIAALHEVGITWSDVKAHNVLINSVTDDAWLIDFRGGGTDKWAEVEGFGTIDGDLATTRKLEDYLRQGEQYGLTKGEA